ncbi:MAG: DUF3179 domain-containing protein [Proteobacteria bacterium]|nr:DUF3179 domain-containing protein [Pseudomonadota bacterium]
MRLTISALSVLFAAIAPAWPVSGAGEEVPASRKHEWTRTDFSHRSVRFDEIRSGGPSKDGIPAIDAPVFANHAEVTDIAPTEPVIALSIGGVDRAYPLRILIWHEIVNDVVAGTPVAVTFCPLCNSSVVFDRRLDGVTLDFGTTGKLRHSDLVMYDRQTESWWQQFLGQAIVGKMTGKLLTIVPSRVESFERFGNRGPNGEVLLQPAGVFRPYGENPYAGYDSLARPFLYAGDMPKNIAPMQRVVVIGKQAWSLDLLNKAGTIQAGPLTLSWQAGQNSALDSAVISQGRDIGNVTVTRIVDGRPVDVAHDIGFAFAFHAFHPDGVIHVK